MTPLVRQKHSRGCVVACLAMITGMDYDAVADEFSGDRHLDGLSDFVYEPWLASQGYATQNVFKHYSPQHADRQVWPPAPFADMHLMTVRTPGGYHATVLLHDGTVLDPNRDAPTKIGDYDDIVSLRGVWKVGGKLDIGPLNFLHWSDGKTKRCQWCGTEEWQYRDLCPARNK